MHVEIWQLILFGFSMFVSGFGIGRTIGRLQVLEMLDKVEDKKDKDHAR